MINENVCDYPISLINNRRIYKTEGVSKRHALCLFMVSCAISTCRGPLLRSGGQCAHSSSSLRYPLGSSWQL